MRRVLIDECINPRVAPLLRQAIGNSSVATVREMNWAGLKDHILIRQIEGRFDVFVTIDKGFEFEHDLRRLSFGIVVVTTENNQIASYERLLEQLVRQIQGGTRGE